MRSSDAGADAKAQQAAKDGKDPLELLEPAFEAEVAKALAFGAAKYGKRNYMEGPVYPSVYYAAMRRHLAAWYSGEECAADSGIHHLAHVAAGAMIAFTAAHVDDRYRPAGLPCACSMPDAECLIHTTTFPCAGCDTPMTCRRFGNCPQDLPRCQVER